MVAITVFLCLTMAVFTATAEMPYSINCEQPDICFMDLIPWCLKGQKEQVLGHCALQKAVCGNLSCTFCEESIKNFRSDSKEMDCSFKNGAEIDFSNSCFLPYTISCEQPRICVRDLRPWCLQGRDAPVLGHCEVQNAICDENASVDITESCMI